MQLHREEWHVRVYQWWYDHKYNRKPWDARKTHTNLCPYMRAVMFWAPLRAIFWNWVTVLNLTPAGNLRITLNMLTIPFLIFAVPQPLGYLSYHLKMLMWAFAFGCLGLAVLGTIIFALYLGVSQLVNFWDEKFPKEEEVPLTWQQVEDARRARQARVTAKYNRKVTRRAKINRFLDLIFNYLRSGHDRICPEIQIVDTPLPPDSPDSGSGLVVYEV